MKNHEIGKITEFNAAKFFSEKGYWVYRCPRTEAGQPADLIVAKDNKITLVEVKHCKSDRFSLNRIEPNQLTTYKFFKRKGNTSHKILIAFKSGVCLFDFKYIYIRKKLDEKSIDFYDAQELGELLYERN